MPPRPSGHFTNEIVELVRLTAQHAESGAQGISTILSAEMISLWVKGYYRDSRSGGQKSTDVLSRLFRQAYDYGVKSGCAALAAQSQGAQTAQLSIGFANNDQGVHVSVMQQNGDGSATVLHHGRVPAGDSFARFALAARAEAPSLGDGEVARLRRVVRALGMEKDIPTDDATLRGCLFSVLGMIALKLERAQQAAAPGALLAILRDVHDTLASESDSDIDHFEDDDEEREGAPVQYAARKVMEVMDMLKAAPSAPGTPEAPKWRKVTGPGQVEVGARLRFNIGDKQFSERAKLILNAGTDKEEVIYDKGRNFYFITSCVMSGFSNHKNVEYLSPKRAAQLDGGQGEGA